MSSTSPSKTVGLSSNGDDSDLPQLSPRPRISTHGATGAQAPVANIRPSSIEDCRVSCFLDDEFRITLEQKPLFNQASCGC